MKFTQTRKAIAAVPGKNIQKDLESAVGTVEKLAAKDKQAAATRTSHLISTVLSLNHTLTAKTRFSIADAIFKDAGDLPHQWERKPGYECGDDNMCSKPNEAKTCYRDTWVPGICQTTPPKA